MKLKCISELGFYLKLHYGDKIEVSEKRGKELLRYEDSFVNEEKEYKRGKKDTDREDTK